MRQHTFIKRELINKGWSGDKKYCIFDTQENKFFLRISPYEQYERKKTEYEFMRQAAELHVPMCNLWNLAYVKKGFSPFKSGSMALLPRNMYGI